MITDDTKCKICGDRRGDHIPTEDGPLTCPRTARKEGVFVMVSTGGWRGMGPAGDDVYTEPTYKFVPNERAVDPLGHGWSPYP